MSRTRQQITQDARNHIRADNFKKATELKKQGFKTAVHALPIEVKSELDKRLIAGGALQTVLQEVSSLFPDVRLPSYVAVGNYRKKYLLGSLAPDVRDVAVAINNTMQEKVIIELKSSITDFYRDLAKNILPALAESLNYGLEQEKQIKLPMKALTDRTLVIAKLIAELNSFMFKGGINVLAYKEKASVTVHGQQEQEEKSVKTKDVYERFARILAKRGFTVESTKQSIVVSQNGSIPSANN